MAEQLKNMFFQRSFFDDFIQKVKQVYPQFNSEKFLKLIYTKDWEDKVLKERLVRFAEVLHEALPNDFSSSCDILIKVEKHFNGFEHLSFAEFVAMYGLEKFEDSMKAIEALTRLSAEFAIRPFINKYPKETMGQMLKWAKHEKVYVRRLASEGCRPRLPWAIGVPSLKKDPSPILPILEILKNDEAENVRRSVSNNLNDISKDHPELVLGIAQRWLGQSPEVDKLLKHALRTLLKKGNPTALAMFGFGEAPKVKVENFKIKDKQVKIGDATEFSFDLTSTDVKPQKLRLEYIVDYVKAKGKTSPKVFQLSESTYLPNKVKKIVRKLDFQNRTTRKHYPGVHKINLMINGSKVGEVECEVV